MPACRRCHRAYDRGELDLLPYLEPAWRAQLAHAVAHGRTLEEAKANVTEALEGALAWRVAEGEPIPAQGQVTVGPVSVGQP